MISVDVFQIYLPQNDVNEIHGSQPVDDNFAAHLVDTPRRRLAGWGTKEEEWRGHRARSSHSDGR